ncbi:carbohydrate porin [Nitrogeniibacter mangrovi]|uniref:Carbohydrate porin n=1 Tax=Nitrogeniibacter mangrovi TaxID=2016596 RepID=A0A6C1AY56_9RHOO|nr:TonB-dependent receptor [Nitrogeniibacter mangrovi]QID16292.1 carbohydrate porin [Nitrogeniibacter mangrovi]
MNRHTLTTAALVALVGGPALAHAAGSDDLQALRDEIAAIRHSYDARIAELEARLKQAEAHADAAGRTAARADDTARQVAARSTTRPAAANAFNPAVSLILSGTYGNFSRDPSSYRIGGFIPGGDEIGPGERGFSLAESELAISANIDPWFYGGLNLALTPENEAEVEQAFVQTTSLPHGLTLKAGRFFSGIGYLNEQHAHTWDFVDAPLAYQAFLGKQFGDDGVQLKWLAPTDLFLEFGAELGRGRNFPGSDRGINGAGAQAVFAHVGGDVGVSHSWRAGLSLLRTTPRDRAYEDVDHGVVNAVSGTSRLWIADFVWKWAPNGDATHTNAKLQGEYFRRKEDGSLVYDVDGAASEGRYASSQSGWYLQGVYQFMPRWRTGLRYDRLNSGSTHYGANAGVLDASGYDPTRLSLMVDWSPSEFSRWRVQVARDKARRDAPDTQLMLQYLMSLGAHGAHRY